MGAGGTGLGVFFEIYNAVQTGIELADWLGGSPRADSKDEHGSQGYGLALSMAGSEGQLALIEDIGYDGFKDAFIQGYEEGEEFGGILHGYTDHPEAIEEILSEVEDFWQSIISRYG